MKKTITSVQVTLLNGNVMYDSDPYEIIKAGEIYFVHRKTRTDNSSDIPLTELLLNRPIIEEREGIIICYMWATEKQSMEIKSILRQAIDTYLATWNPDIPADGKAMFLANWEHSKNLL